MALYIPTIQSAYVLDSLFSDPKWTQLMSSGVIDFNTIQAAFGAARNGDYVNVPQLIQSSDFGRADITTNGDGTFTAAATNDDKAVVLRDYAGNSWQKSDEIRSGENFLDKYSRTAGNKLAKRLLGQVGNVLNGAVDAITSPGTKAHTEDHTGSPITVHMVRAAKARLDDQGGNLNTALIHSHVWFDLVKDLQGYNNLDIVGGEVIRSSRLAEIMGISNWIISDDMPNVAAGFSTDDDNIYSTFLLGPESIYFAYQHDPEVELDSNVVRVSTVRYMKISMDYVLHCRGLAWGGSANPADADLATYTNWGYKTEDHRNIKAVKILSAGQSGKI